jgi:hypothetical protein
MHQICPHRWILNCSLPYFIIRKSRKSSEKSYQNNFLECQIFVKKSARMSDDRSERCSSAPVTKWIELSQNKFASEFSFKPINYLTQNKPDNLTDANSNTTILRPSSLRLRRHSSLTRGILQRVRTNSEADERPGEAKVIHILRGW